ncbi:MAG TPA: flagellar basal body-associated FliL family protein [Planctomycetota bacterium]
MSSQASPAPPAAPSPRSRKALVLVGVALLALAGGGVVALRLGKPHASPVERAAPVASEPGVLEIEPFVLNLPDPTGDRYFRLNLRLVLDQRAVAQRTGHGLPKVKLHDRLLSVLAGKRASELATAEGKEALRAEIWSAAQPLFDAPPFHDPAQDPAPARILDVLFTEFLLQ